MASLAGDKLWSRAAYRLLPKCFSLLLPSHAKSQEPFITSHPGVTDKRTPSQLTHSVSPGQGSISFTTDRALRVAQPPFNLHILALPGLPAGLLESYRPGFKFWHSRVVLLGMLIIRGILLEAWIFIRKCLSWKYIQNNDCMKYMQDTICKTDSHQQWSMTRNKEI